MAKNLKGLGSLQKHTFQLLVFLIPSQLAKHFWPNWSLVWGIRVDYLAPAIYLTDLIIIALLGVWLLEIVINKLEIKDASKRGVRSKIVATVLLVFAFALINIYLAEHRPTSLLRWLKMFEFTLLAVYVAKSKRFEYKSWFIKPLSYSVILFSTIAILQFVGQQTSGRLFYLLGERSFTMSTPGIALVNLFGKEYLRPYSTFGHPNAMGGYFLVTTLLFLDYLKRKSRDSRVVVVALILSIAGVVLSFSEGVVMAVVFIITYLLLTKKFRVNNKRLINLLLLVVVVLSLVSPVMFGKLQRPTVELFGRESIIERIELATISGKLISNSPLTGVGINNFVYHVPEEGLGYSVAWWLQPVHNIFLLCFAEVGLVGMILIVYLFYKALNKSIDNKEVIALVLLVVIITGTFDHYWLTLQQNLIMLFIVFGLAFRINSTND